MRRPTNAAFTLTELLAVIAIIALLAAVAVPSFSAITEGTNRSLAENKLQLAAAAASDLAARSSLNQDVVLAFFYDTDPLRATRDRARLAGDPTDAQLAALSRNEQRIRAQVFIKVGSFPDVSEDSSATDVIDREVFVPSPAVSPVVLPKGWEIRGYVPAGWMNEDGWYAGDRDLYAGENDQPHWVFPETSFFSRGEPGESSSAPLTTAENGSRRQTFVLRFQGGTGRVVPSDARELLLYDPLISRRARSDQHLTDLSPYEFSDWGTLVAAVEAYTAQNASNSGGPYTELQLRQVMGNESADTVLARPVQQIVLYQLNDMLGPLGARADRGTGTIYPSVLCTELNEPYDPADLTVPGSSAQGLFRIRNWIQTGDRDGELRQPRDDDQDEQAFPTRVYALDLYTGRLREVTR